MQALIVASAVALAGPEVAVGGQLGVLAWQRAGDHTALLAPGVVLAVRPAGAWGLTGELDGALAMERNADVLLVTVPMRLLATVDLVVRRTGVVWSTGVGPGVSLQLSTLESGGQRFGGASVRPVGRARTSLDGPIYGAVRWRFSAGVGVRPAGADWDVAAGLLVVP